MIDVEVNRKPARKLQTRSRERQARILEAARQLLETTAINELSLYQVAEMAEIPPSSLYHFYPKVDALLEALQESIFQDFDAILNQPFEDDSIQHWSDIIKQLQARYVAYYREHYYVRTLILGQHGSGTLRHADFLHDEALGCRIRIYFETYFQLPPLPDTHNIFAIALQIADKVYGMSHQKHGNITDELADEGLKAALAYLGVYLPSQLMCRG